LIADAACDPGSVVDVVDGVVDWTVTGTGVVGGDVVFGVADLEWVTRYALSPAMTRTATIPPTITRLRVELFGGAGDLGWLAVTRACCCEVADLAETNGSVVESKCDVESGGTLCPGGGGLSSGDV
jgi:hypothetical protein